MKKLYQVDMWSEKLIQWLQVLETDSKDYALQYIQQSSKGKYRIHELFVVE